MSVQNYDGIAQGLTLNDASLFIKGFTDFKSKPSLDG